MKVNLSETRKRAEAEGLLGAGTYLKLQEGDNRIRLMSEFLEHPSDFKGERRFKWLCYVIDRKDGKIKPFFMPNTIYKQIEALQLNPDYAFDEVPMPYDITVNAVGAGNKEVVYTVVPARANTPLTESEASQIREMQSIRELQKVIYDAENDGPAKPSGPLPIEPPPLPARHSTVPPEFRQGAGRPVADDGRPGSASDLPR